MVFHLQPITASPYKQGGHVRGKGKPIGTNLLIKYHIKNIDSIPAILSPNEYVLTPAMEKKVRKAFKKAHMKGLKGL